ncbi:MAG: T9SS type A sorting domain-containing protein [bacterium]|nr:T9SS type A sorting domain-containing protein [bacterium]
MLNKTIIENLETDTTDSFVGSADFTNIKEHKKSMLSIVNSDNSQSQFGAQQGIISLSEYKLYQSYPNPFNPVTRISYSIPQEGLVTLKVYDLLGKEVATLINEIIQPGNHFIDFNAANISSGVYFYRIQSGEFSDVKRMVVIK